MKEKIDIVITWVDDNDEKWLKEKERYQTKKNNKENSIIRYRDWGLLKYWFRGVEKFAPWVNKIYFVTYGHIPNWLNIDNPKICVVNHKDFIPAGYLPTFSSRPIELNFHRIKNLSEKFIYFNDDMFLTNYITIKDFFKNGYPKYSAISDSLRGTEINGDYVHNILNASIIINKYFNKRKCMINNFNKWFSFKYGKYNLKNILNFPYKECSRLCNFHSPYPYLKSTYKEVWKYENDTLEATCYNKFRTYYDLNQTIFWYWAIFKGEFYPQNVKICKYHKISRNNRTIVEDIKNKKYKILCINDAETSSDINFEKTKKELIDAFECVLNEKSSFEK